MDPEELRVAIRTYLDKGPDFIKFGGTAHFARPAFIGFSAEAQNVIVEEAHARNKVAETHATTVDGLRMSVLAGVDLIQHPEFTRGGTKPDAQNHGIGSIIAIEGLVELGMTPAQAMVAATKNGAIASRGLDHLGTIQAGKLADLLILEADPLRDISNLRKLRTVMRGGKVVDRESLPVTRVLSR